MVFLIWLVKFYIEYKIILVWEKEGDFFKDYDIFNISVN